MERIEKSEASPKNGPKTKQDGSAERPKSDLKIASKSMAEVSHPPAPEIHMLIEVVYMPT